MTALLRPAAVWLAVWSICIAVGISVATNRQVGLILAVALVGAFALLAPPAYWIAAALVAALTFRGLVTMGALPSVATYLDIPLVWGALASALLKRERPSQRAAVHLRWLGTLAAAVLIAWLFHRSELLRPVLYLALLGEPFALIGALLLDPPTPQLRRMLTRLLAGLIAVQVPVAFGQFAHYGFSDQVAGTLSGAGAGAHVMSAVVVLGALWAVSGRAVHRSPRRLAAAGLLFVVPFLADAKQVIFVLPAAAVAGRWSAGRVSFLLRIALVAGAVVALIVVYPAGKSAVYFLQQARHGHSGKAETAKIVWKHLSSDPQSVLFGKGPAETVSRAAFMTTDLLQADNSPLRVLGLKPASITVEAEADAVQVSNGNRSGGATSFNSGVSSLLGVVGDLGIFGALAYAGLLVSIVLALARERTAEAVAASGGWAMFAVLGLVFDWWEQPPFTVSLALLTALALTPRPPPERAQR